MRQAKTLPSATAADINPGPVALVYADHMQIICRSYADHSPETLTRGALTVSSAKSGAIVTSGAPVTSKPALVNGSQTLAVASS
jgi:hypothetical protein